MLLLHNQRAPRIADALAALRAHINLFSYAKLALHPVFKVMCCSALATELGRIAPQLVCTAHLVACQPRPGPNAAAAVVLHLLLPVRSASPCRLRTRAGSLDSLQ